MSDGSYMIPTTHRGAEQKDGAKTPLRVVTQGVLTSPFILINSLETAAPFNVVIHPRCCEPRNWNLEKFRPLDGIEPVTIGTKYNALNRLDHRRSILITGKYFNPFL